MSTRRNVDLYSVPITCKPVYWGGYRLQVSHLSGRERQGGRYPPLWEGVLGMCHLFPDSKEWLDLPHRWNWSSERWPLPHQPPVSRKSFIFCNTSCCWETKAMCQSNLRGGSKYKIWWMAHDERWNKIHLIYNELIWQRGMYVLNLFLKTGVLSS